MWLLTDRGRPNQCIDFDTPWPIRLKPAVHKGIGLDTQPPPTKMFFEEPAIAHVHAIVSTDLDERVVCSNELNRCSAWAVAV